MTPLPPLVLDEWRPTRDRLWACVRLLGKVRSAFTPRQRHWAHVSLPFGLRGPTTGPIQSNGDRFELELDLVEHRLNLTTNVSDGWGAPIAEVSTGQVLEALEAVLGHDDLAPIESVELPALEVFAGYDPGAAHEYLTALGRIDSVFRTFRGRLHGEALPVQLWPHHFDLAVLYLTGRRVPGVDPDDEDLADESANYGFSTGDEGIPAPYLYATAYPPLPCYADLTSHPGSVLQEEGWQGVRMDYARLTHIDDPEEDLLSFLTTVHTAVDGALAQRAEGAGQV